MTENFPDLEFNETSGASATPTVGELDLEQRSSLRRLTRGVNTYTDEQSAANHKETAHYLKWRDEVATMMAEPRKGVKYNLLAH